MHTPSSTEDLHIVGCLWWGVLNLHEMHPRVSTTTEGTPCASGDDGSMALLRGAGATISSSHRRPDVNPGGSTCAEVRSLTRPPQQTQVGHLVRNVGVRDAAGRVPTYPNRGPAHFPRRDRLGRGPGSNDKGGRLRNCCSRHRAPCGQHSDGPTTAPETTCRNPRVVGRRIEETRAG